MRTTPPFGLNTLRFARGGYSAVKHISNFWESKYSNKTSMKRVWAGNNCYDREPIVSNVFLALLNFNDLSPLSTPSVYSAGC